MVLAERFLFRRACGALQRSTPPAFWAQKNFRTLPRTTAIRCFGSSSNNKTAATTAAVRKTKASNDVQKPSSNNNRDSSVYVHPLSQIVLLYMQKECHEWICANKLDRNLTLHRDGSFVLDNAAFNDESTCRCCLRIWTYYDVSEKKHWLAYTVSSSAGSNKCTNSGDGDDDDDATDKETALPAKQRRFLLQDNLMPAWNAGTRRKSLPERVEDSVRELLKQANQDLQQHHQKQQQRMLSRPNKE